MVNSSPATWTIVLGKRNYPNKDKKDCPPRKVEKIPDAKINKQKQDAKEEKKNPCNFHAFCTTMNHKKDK